MTVLQKHLYKLRRLEKLATTEKHEINRQNALRGVEREKKCIASLENPNDEIFYGAYNSVSKKFCFGIRAYSKTKASEELVKMIGKDANKWRWTISAI